MCPLLWMLWRQLILRKKRSCYRIRFCSTFFPYFYHFDTCLFIKPNKDHDTKFFKGVRDEQCSSNRCGIRPREMGFSKQQRGKEKGDVPISCCYHNTRPHSFTDAGFPVVVDTTQEPYSGLGTPEHLYCLCLRHRCLMRCFWRW